MRFNTQRNLLAVTVALACAGISGISAQEADSNAVIEESAIESAATDETSPQPQGTVEEVVVTGSRLRRDTFSSISPLQIITTEFAKEAGLIDAADILQGSTAATGQQIDLTFKALF